MPRQYHKNRCVSTAWYTAGTMTRAGVLITAVTISLLFNIGLVGALWYSHHTKEELRARAGNEYETLERELAAARLQFTMSETERERLEANLAREEERNDAFAAQISAIGGTVDTLDRLAQLDEELLQKYSRVYFLNENYVPRQLRRIDNAHLFEQRGLEYILREVEPFLDDLMDDARDDDIDLSIVSAYRSFDEQAALKGEYLVQYGSGANAFSADQGYSEHQLGTAVDFTTTALNGGLTGFENTDAYAWLTDNAHKYGFTLSYPQGNEFYIFEPWHWRFVGVELATYLHRYGLHFYDLPQREINDYLIDIFKR